MKPSYFKTAGKGYNAVNSRAGDVIDFYNILYIENNNVQFDQYDQVFGSEGNSQIYQGTISQLMSSGIPS